jgi:hypothetical protein
VQTRFRCIHAALHEQCTRTEELGDSSHCPNRSRRATNDGLRAEHVIAGKQVVQSRRATGGEELDVTCSFVVQQDIVDARGKLTGGLLGWRSSFTAPMLRGEPDSAALALPDDQTRRVLITSLVISTGRVDRVASLSKTGHLGSC